MLDYEIIEEAISRLKANLNRNRSLIIRKKNTIEVIYCSMQSGEQRIASSHPLLMSFCFICVFSPLSFSLSLRIEAMLWFVRLFLLESLRAMCQATFLIDDY